MKFFFTCLVLAVATASVAQTLPEPVFWPIDSTTGKIQFREVVQVDPSMTQQTIIQRTRLWVTGMYQNANAVIQQDDPAGGLLVLKGIITVPKVTTFKLMGTHTSTAQMPINHTLTIETKPGRYRVTVSDLTQTDQRIPINPRYSSTDSDEFAIEMTKAYADLGFKGMGERAAKKDQTNYMITERSYAASVISHFQAMLDNLKKEIQKKGEKDW